jgi:ABC-type transport system substrate-binding protein
LLRRLAAISLLLSIVFAAVPARSARRPRYGGTLRVEIGAAIASLDPNVAASTLEEAEAKVQIDALIYDHWSDVDGSLDEAGSGPFRVTVWEAGKRATLTANDNFREGRPFVDAIEITMGRTAHDRLVDLELNKTDLTEIPAQDARRAAEQGVRVSTTQPDELLALVFVGGNAARNAAGTANVRPAGPAARQMASQAQVTGHATDPAIGQALSLVIDRVAIVNFILQKSGEPAGGLLPQWSSGTAFLFPAAAPTAADLAHAKELWKQIAPSPQLVLGYDFADPLEQSVAERIVVNAKEAGMALRAQALPVAEQSRGAAQAPGIDLRLVRWRMSSPLPGDALASFLTRIYGWPLKGVETSAFPRNPSPEDIYKQQRAVLDTYRVVPLVWLPQVYGLSARVRDWKAPGPGENWPLADVWLDTEVPNGTASSPQ